ncbi:putative terpene synthase 9 [Gossypium australe]|uniref:Putative terpene synthase 9 n=1 Tax=Gossypium australe TaxID=47621 RepID=A0A5B6VDR9_9ROSI|nr:putative terpene synthase 9 [Gossypium australe]
MSSGHSENGIIDQVDGKRYKNPKLWRNELKLKQILVGWFEGGISPEHLTHIDQGILIIRHKHIPILQVMSSIGRCSRSKLKDSRSGIPEVAVKQIEDNGSCLPEISDLPEVAVEQTKDSRSGIPEVAVKQNKDTSLASLSLQWSRLKIVKSHGSRLEELKQCARELLASVKDARCQLDLMQRPGVAYLFENQIHDIFAKFTHQNVANDLYTVAMQFRILRQNGLFISTG